MQNDNSDSPVMQIPLYRNRFAIVDEVDSDLGQYKWSAKKAKSTYYVSRKIYKTQKCTLLHRVIMSRMIGRDLESFEFVDHKNHDGLDNRRSNLRLASHSQNMRNRRPGSNCKSGYKGVSWDKKNLKWTARIYADGKIHLLGRFASIRDAVIVWNEAALIHHGEFAYLNPIPNK